MPEVDLSGIGGSDGAPTDLPSAIPEGAFDYTAFENNENTSQSDDSADSLDDVNF